MKKDKVIEIILPVLENKGWKMDKYEHLIRTIAIENDILKYRIKFQVKNMRIDQYLPVLKEWRRIDSQYYGRINVLSSQIEVHRLAIITDSRPQLFAKINTSLWGTT